MWRQEGLKVPEKQKTRKRLWLNDGSCVRLHPAWKNHVWSYNFVQCRTENDKFFRILVILDEYSRECLALHVRRSIRAEQVMHVLTDLFITHSVPGNIRSDNGPEFIAKSLRKWLKNVGVQTQYIQPGSPWENRYCESFNGKLRNHFLDDEIFTTLREAKILIETWRKH